MLRGVTFQWDRAEDFFLNLALLMDVITYDWYVDDIDLNGFEFQSGKFSGAAFKNILCKLSLLSFVRIRRYPIGSAVNDMDTYQDYLESDCDMLVLFYDGGFYELYEKDEDLIHRTFQLCAEKGFDQVEYTTDENDQRYRMYF